MKLRDSGEVERILRQLDWPVPSEHLRARILAEAPGVARRIAWSDRVWFSRAWRLGAVVMAASLLAINLWPGLRASRAPAPSPRALAEAGVVEQTSRQAGLLADVTASFARRAWAQAAEPRAGDRAWPTLPEFTNQGERR